MAKKAAKETAKAPAPKPTVAEPTQELSEEPAEGEEDNDEVSEFTHDGVTYLKGSGGVLYDHTKFTSDNDVVTVGVWNEETQSIDPAPEEDEESDDDEESED